MGWSHQLAKRLEPICKGKSSETNLHEIVFHVNFQGCIVQLKTAKTATKETNLIGQKQTRKQNIWKETPLFEKLYFEFWWSIARTHVNKLLLGPRLENIPFSYHRKCRLPFSVKQLHVKLPTGRTTWEEKVERWVGGEFFDWKIWEITHDFNRICGNFSTESSHWKVLTSFCFLLPFDQLLLLAAYVARNGIVDEEYVILADFFPDTLPGTNYSNCSPWKLMVGRWHFLLGPANWLLVSGRVSVKSMEAKKNIRHLMSARWFWPAILLPPLPVGRVPPQRLLGSSGVVERNFRNSNVSLCFSRLHPPGTV